MVWLSYPTRSGWGLRSLPHASGSAYAAVMPDRYGVAFVWIEPAPSPQPLTVFESAFGFHVQRFVSSPGLMRIIVIPSWFALPVLAALPTYWAQSRWRDARRRESNRCPRCGYDLRATPDRCPECGARAVPPPGETTRA